MKATQRFIFVCENNYKQGVLPTVDSTTPNIVQRNIKDRFRQIIGNYWYPRMPNGKPDPGLNGSDLVVNQNSTLVWHEKKSFPFEIKLGSTHNFSTYKTIPTALTITPITLIADKRFGPYPDCSPCWFRYLYGYEMGDPTQTVNKVYGFDPLKLQDVESSFTIADPTLAANSQVVQKLGALTPLSMLLLTDAGLPTTNRLNLIGVDISYLSFGKILESAIRSLTEPPQQSSATSTASTTTTAAGVSVPQVPRISGGTLGISSGLQTRGGMIQGGGAAGIDTTAPPEPTYTLSYNAKVFRDSAFDNEIAVLDEVEQAMESGIDFSLNATVEFIHNYAANEYDRIIAEDTLQLGLDEFGGETKLANMYEHILNNKLEPTILKLRNELDCFVQNLAVFFRNSKSDSKVIYVLAETLPLINRFYPFQNLLPYYARINFKLQPTGPVGGAAEEARNDGLLMRHLQENPSIAEINNFRTFKQTSASKNRGKKYASLLLQESRDLLKSWEYYEWVLKLGERLSNIRTQTTGTPYIRAVDGLPLDSIILNDKTRTAYATRGENTPDAAYGLALKSLHVKMADLVKFYGRNYPQLLKGERPHKEVIAYKVVKYSGFSAPSVTSMNQIIDTTLYTTLFGDNGIINQGNATPVQEIWFFNTAKEEVINYIDTQVTNNRFYTYIVYAYLVVLESEYYYTNVGNTKLPCEERHMDFGL